ncbi:C6 finger domain-containing protein [Histoplasma capsulatum H143]|uniref:C6 finger domain-containing protein n=1 Tax=Ajellomyces capsulatus (strain H143) TaxID=544712 RepID=C6H3E9_AJECH|nr:C6 finger domain-containing protein [Histoplasma capsulatum H143]
MMGLTFGNVTAKKASPGYPVHGVVPPGGNEPADSVSTGGLGLVQTSLGLPCNIGCLSSWSPSLVVSNVVEECPRSGVAFPEWNSSGRCNETERGYNPPIPLTLIDPLFQGLDKISRHYLTYFDRNFCKLMVLFEVPHNNPYRRLIQMVNVSSGLCAAMAAIGACHHLHILHYSDQSQPVERSCKSKGSLLEDGEQFARSPNPNVRVAYQHLLLLKHRALCQLEQTLSNPKTRGEDAPIASALLLMVLDMVESGRGTWKLHVEGAKKLLQSRIFPLLAKASDGASPLPRAIYDGFNMFLAGSCLTGSHWRTPPVLESSDSTDSNIPFSNSDALYHLASAYKITITIYAIRILLHPSPNECTFFAEQVTKVLNHLSLIPPTSELFKSILWPTFIAGAECRCPEQRTWFHDKLDQMWRQCWTLNIREAMRVLDVIWRREYQHDGDWRRFDRLVQHRDKHNRHQLLIVTAMTATTDMRIRTARIMRVILVQLRAVKLTGRFDNIKQHKYLPLIRTQLPHHSLRMVKAGLEFSAGTVDASSVSAMADSADWCLSPLAMPHQPTSITSLCQSASPIPSGFGTNYHRWVVQLGRRGMGINSSKGRDKGMVWVQVAQVIVQQMTGLVDIYASS